MTLPEPRLKSVLLPLNPLKEAKTFEIVLIDRLLSLGRGWGGPGLCLPRNNTARHADIH
jgi:hypothetical protein